jgi:hypothetical protein
VVCISTALLVLLGLGVVRLPAALALCVAGGAPLRLSPGTWASGPGATARWRPR